MMRFYILLAAFVVAALPASAQTEPVRIVVLGSSNAAGTGPSVQDSAWVNRLRAHLSETRPGSEVINRARGGYLTYHLMPTGYVPPAGRQRPDEGRNITKAIADNPDAIIVSLTSNDADLGYTPVEQLARYDSMRAAAGDIPVYFTTTTPRSFWRNNGAGTPAQKRAIQAVLKDSTLARYGDRGIDFWTDLATADSIPAAATSSGDGVHFNDAGHRIFVARVLASTLVETAVSTDADDSPARSTLGLRAVPNPSPTMIEADGEGGETRVDVFDVQGRHVRELFTGRAPSGTLRVPVGYLAPGLYVVRLVQDGQARALKVSVVR